MRHGILAFAAAALMAGPSHAQNYEADIMAQLRDQGYVGITLSHTWLGRTRIVATLHGDLREIVFDPNTGEILRDLSRTLMADSGSGSSGTSVSAPLAAVPTGATVASAAGVTGTATGTSTEAGVDVAAATGAASAAPNQSTGLASPSGGVAGVDPVTGWPFLILQPAGGR